MGHVPIGKIIGAHGVRGTCRVYSYMESPHALKPGISLLFKDQKDTEKTCEIVWAKPHKKTTILMALKGIKTREQAEELIGFELFMDRKCFPELESGTYYWHDLIGLDVYTADEAYIGNLVSVIPTGSNDVYVVKNPDTNQETLIPALTAVVLEIDLKKRKMRVNLPEGLS